MRLIGIVGKKQSGKDEVCKIIREHYPTNDTVRIAFADSLKEEVADFCNVTVEDIEKHKERFRLILQGYGTDFRRGQNPRYWLDRWQRKVQEECQHRSIIIAPDVRFLNEAELIRSMGGELWGIVRIPHYITHDTHQSELELTRIKTDHFIDNNKDIDYIEQQVTKLL